MSQTLLTTLALFWFAAVANANVITISFDQGQKTPAGQTGSAPAWDTSASPPSWESYWGITFVSDVASSSNNPVICSGNGPLCFNTDIGIGVSLNQMYLNGHVLAGSLDSGSGLGSLTLTFASPTTILDFGALVGTTSAVQLSVALSGPGFPGQSRQIITLSSGVGSDLSENMFDYSGPPITQAVITFNSDGVPVFAIDNLTYSTPEVPEPGSLTLFGVGLLVICVQARKQWGSRTRI